MLQARSHPALAGGLVDTLQRPAQRILADDLVHAQRLRRHRIANLMIERIDLVHAGEVQGIKVKWREVGWNALIEEFAPDSIGAELLEVEA
jgi:hypothetical protein